jgi:hypothetical protein
LTAAARAAHIARMSGGDMSGSGMAIEELEPVDLDRAAAFHLPTLGWLFVLLAVVQAVLVGQLLYLQVQLVPALIVNGDSSAGGIILRLIATVATVLLPAAILYRAPTAWRTHRLLLLGAMLVAAWTVASEADWWVVNQLQDVMALERASTIAQWGTIINLAGLVLMGVGLARLRQHPPSPRANAVSVVAMLIAGLIAILPILVGFGPDPGLELPLAPIASWLLTALATGYLLSVPLGAWLDREPAHRFWMVLGVVSLVLLAMIGSQGVQFLLADRSAGSFFVLGFGPATGLVLAATGLVTLALYARALPDPTAQA